MLSKSILHKNLYFRYILFLLVIAPNIIFITKQYAKTVFTTESISVLDKLKESVSEEDYIVSWWDYGYYLRYYAYVNTVNDGGQQLGKILYPTSVLFLNSSQKESAILSQLLTYEVSKYKGLNYLRMMMKTYGYKDPKNFFQDLSNNKIIPKENKFDTYLYIPSQMIDIYGAIDQVYRTDLATGSIIPSNKYFYKSPKPVDFKNKNIVTIDNNIIYTKEKEELYFKKYNNTNTIKKIITISYQKNGKVSLKQKRTGHLNGYIMIKLYDGKVLIMDDIVFDSTIIQLGVLQNYNRNIFEPIYLSKEATIYKVKKQ